MACSPGSPVIGSHAKCDVTLRAAPPLLLSMRGECEDESVSPGKSWKGAEKRIVLTPGSCGCFSLCFEPFCSTGVYFGHADRVQVAGISYQPPSSQDELRSGARKTFCESRLATANLSNGPGRFVFRTCIHFIVAFPIVICRYSAAEFDKVCADNFGI